MQVSFYLPNGTSVTGGQYNFAATLGTALRPTVSSNSAHDYLAFSIENQNGSGLLSPQQFGIVVGGKNSSNAGKVIMYVNFTGTASGSSQNTVIARIPLT